MSRAETRRRIRSAQRADKQRGSVTPRPTPPAPANVIGNPLALAGVLLVTLLLYLRCLGSGFVFDDNLMVVKNAYIGSWSFFRISFSHDSWWYLDPLHLPASSYYRPLQDTWLGLHFHLFGLNPAGWHATMVALHLLVVWLVFRLASHLTGDRQAALLAAALFAVLPCHAEAVVWASAIPLPLAAAFELAALLLFIGRAQAPYRNWALAMLLYAGALLTHESAVMFNDRRRGLYLFCVTWMAIAIAPMMNLRGIFQGSLVQDRYRYLPSVAWCVMIADCAVRAARIGATARRGALILPELPLDFRRQRAHAGVIGRTAERQPALLERLLIAALGVKRLRQEQMRLRVVRIDADGVLEGRERLLIAPLVLHCEALHHPDFRIFGKTPDEVIQNRFGGGGVAVPPVDP